MLFFVSVYLWLNLLLVRWDIRCGLLPDRLTCPLLWLGLLWHCTSRTMLLPEAVLGAIAGYVSFAAIYWGFRWLYGYEGLGYGDVKYLSALGAWHGWESLPALVCIAATLACGLVLLRGIVLRSLQTIKNPLPFGPCLAAAGLLVGIHTLLQT